MRIRPSIALVAFTLATTSVACSEGFTAPKASPMPVGAPMPDVIVDWVAEDSLSADFTVTPTGGAFQLGPHAIYFPANSICDPARSSYGPTEWDAPCEPLTEPIQIHAEIRRTDSTSWVDFTPALRFVPTADPLQYVWIYLHLPGSNSPDVDVQGLSILWIPEPGAQGVNEALSDETQKTYFWREGEIVFRRIKHFSGYQGSALTDFEEVSGLVGEVSF